MKHYGHMIHVASLSPEYGYENRPRFVEVRRRDTPVSYILVKRFHHKKSRKSRSRAIIRATRFVENSHRTKK